MIDNLEDGWVPWLEGACPLPVGCDHEVMFRNGVVAADNHPEKWHWSHNNSESDIIAYRLVSK